MKKIIKYSQEREHWRELLSLVNTRLCPLLLIFYLTHNVSDSDVRLTVGVVLDFLWGLTDQWFIKQDNSLTKGKTVCFDTHKSRMTC